MGASSVTAGRWTYVLYGGGGRALAATSEVMLAQGISPQAPFLTRLRRPQRGPDANGLQIPWGPPLSWDRSQEGSLQDWPSYAGKIYTGKDLGPRGPRPALPGLQWLEHTPGPSSREKGAAGGFLHRFRLRCFELQDLRAASSGVGCLLEKEDRICLFKWN